MINQRLLPAWILACLTLFIACQSDATQSQEEEVPSLQRAYQDNFFIGTALSARQILGQIPDSLGMIPREFNAITPENVMKWGVIHPEPDSFSFEIPDQYVAYGEQHDMHVVGHTLVWHSQLSPWVKEIQDSATLREVMKNHIEAVAGRYKGRIDGWDVVNEALNEDGTLRKSIFLDLMGPDFIQTAFELAAAADPEAELYYNDYNMCEPAKREGAIALIKQLQANNVKIDGVGLQGHWKLETPTLEEIENSILQFSALGIKVMFTELDITVLPNPWDMTGADVNVKFESGDSIMNPYPGGLPDSVSQQLAARYESIFQLFLKHQDKISRVTFWGVHDGHSWLNGWPIRGRTNYPLLFDRNFQPKEAYHRVMALKATEATAQK